MAHFRELRGDARVGKASAFEEGAFEGGALAPFVDHEPLALGEQARGGNDPPQALGEEGLVRLPARVALEEAEGDGAVGGFDPVRGVGLASDDK